MNAIFKRELRDYFCGIFGWIFAAVLVLAGGALSTVVNLIGSSGDITYLFASLPELLILLLPFAASRSFTRENAKCNSVWLASLPISRTSLILGKFFAALVLFLLPTAVLALFPPLLNSFGKVAYGSAYIALLGYVLLGASLLAICCFVASHFRLRPVSIVVNAVICLVIYLLPILATLFYALPLVSFLFCVLVCIAIGAVVAIRSKRPLPAILTAVIPSLLFTAIYFLLPGFFDRVLPDIISWLSLFDRLGGFRSGHFDLPAAVLYLSITVLFVFLTIQTPAGIFRKGGVKQ